MTAASNLALVKGSGACWLVLTPEEIMARTGWSRATYFRRRAELVSRPSQICGPHGEALTEYLESSIPAPQPDAQLAVVEPSAQQALFSASAEPRKRVTLPDPQDQAQANRRMDAIEPVLDFEENPQRFVRLQLEGGRPVNSRERMIEYAAEISGQSPRTIKRWLAAYRGRGFAALADRIRTDKGTSRWFAQHRDAAILAAYLYLNERQSVTFVAEQLEAEAERLGLGDLPSRETVRIFLTRSISPAMKTLAREGERQYRERMAPYLKRGYLDVYANEIWVGDHAIHDVEVQNDIFEEVPFGTPGRLRITAFEDFRSRKVWATWAWEGSSRSIAATLLRAMLEDGPPASVYVDNGKDYKRVAKGATPASELPLDDDDRKAPPAWWEDEYKSIERIGLLARLGISVTHCIPRHPQSKPVERFFRTMHMRFDACHSTYTSGSPFTRPEATERAMMRHRRLLKAGRVAESAHPLASRFILGCLSWIREYNARPQTGEGMDGCSPDQVFAEERNPNQKPMPPLSDLALLFADRVTRTVHECAVRINRYRYAPAPADRVGWAAMHEANEAGSVIVAYNAEDPEYCAVLDLDGRFIAWLEAEPLARFAPNDPAVQAQIAESMSIRRGMEKATKSSLAAIAAAARSNGAKSAEENLYGRLQLPAPSGAPVVTQRKPRLAPKTPAAAPMTPAEVARTLLED